MIANYAAMDIRPGSMGRPLPGIDAAIVRRTARRHGWRSIDEPGRRRASWRCGPAGRRCSAATGTTRRDIAKCFVGGYYLTGDLATRDADGYFWFVGRADDVIKSSGHLIGPFEVESALLEHPAVAEAGVIGKPDPVALEIVKAFVALKPGSRADRGAAARVCWASRACGSAPPSRRRRSTFVDAVPKNRAGKIMRRLLKARELGLPEGDTSTLEAIMITDLPVERRSARSRPTRSHLLQEMLRIRRFEEKCAELYSAGKIRGFLHLYIGEEAVAVGVMQALTPEDAIVATYREHGHALARGIAAGRAHGRDVRQAGGLQPRPRRLDAPLRRRHALLRRQRHRRRRAAGRGRPGAGRQDAGAGRASPPASSATAPSPRASSTSR